MIKQVQHVCNSFQQQYSKSESVPSLIIPLQIKKKEEKFLINDNGARQLAGVGEVKVDTGRKCALLQ